MVVSGSYGLPPMRPALFSCLGFSYFLPSSLRLVGQDGFLLTIAGGGTAFSSDGEKHGFMTSVVGLASQKWGIEGDWPLGIVMRNTRRILQICQVRKSRSDLSVSGRSGLGLLGRYFIER